MADRMAKHVLRGEATQTAFDLLPAIPDVPEEAKLAHRGLITAVDTEQVASDKAATSVRMHGHDTDDGWRVLWAKCGKWLGIAKVKATGNFRAGLENISTDVGWSEWAARRRAQQILAALTEAPENFTASDLTKAQLETLITEQLARDAEQRRLETVAHDAKIALHNADHALDQENKRLYQILIHTFDPDTREGEIVKTIPTETATKTTQTQTATTTTTGTATPQPASPSS